MAILAIDGKTIAGYGLLGLGQTPGAGYSINYPVQIGLFNSIPPFTTTGIVYDQELIDSTSIGYSRVDVDFSISYLNGYTSYVNQSDILFPVSLNKWERIKTIGIFYNSITTFEPILVGNPLLYYVVLSTSINISSGRSLIIPAYSLAIK